MATFRKRKSGWSVVVRVTGLPSTGKTFGSKAEAREWAESVEFDLKRRRKIMGGEVSLMTLREALDKYLAEVTARKPKGKTQESSLIGRWIRHPLAERGLTELRGKDFAVYRDDRLDDGKAAQTVRNELSLISKLYKTARRDWGYSGLINPIDDMSRPPPDPGRERRLSPGEEKRLLQAAGWPKAGFFIFLLETGMRRGELSQIHWDSVRVPKRGDDANGPTILLRETKNGSARTVPLSRRALKVLRALCRGGRLHSGHPDLISHWFADARDKAGITDLRLHDLRHEATSRFFERGFDVMEVSMITGHKTLAMLQRYTHLHAGRLAARL